MQLEDIEEDREFGGKNPGKDGGHVGGSAGGGNDGNHKGSASTDQRRGSHLLAAAGIDYERRRKHSFQNSDSRIYQDGNEVSNPFCMYRKKYL